MASPRTKFPWQLLLLVIAFAFIGTASFQTFKDRRAAANLLQSKEKEIQTLGEQLQMDKKKWTGLFSELKNLSARKEKMDEEKLGLTKQLIELQNIKRSTEDDKKKLELSLQDRENEIGSLKEKLRLFPERVERDVKLLKEELVQKEKLIDKLKEQLREYLEFSSVHGDLMSGKGVGTKDKEGNRNAGGSSDSQNTNLKNAVLAGDTVTKRSGEKRKKQNDLENQEIKDDQQDEFERDNEEDIKEDEGTDGNQDEYKEDEKEAMEVQKEIKTATRTGDTDFHKVVIHDKKDVDTERKIDGGKTKDIHWES